MTEKSVAEKTRIKPGTTIAVLNRVPGIIESLGLPESVVLTEPDRAELVFLFAGSRAEFVQAMDDVVAQLRPGAALWVFFRKGSKAAGLDMNRDTIWAHADRLGMRPLGLVSIDETWSAFRLRPAS